MKKFTLYIILFCTSHISYAQSTWMQKLNFRDWSPYQNEDSLTGIKDISIGPDGDIYVLANYGQTNQQEVYKIDPTGAAIHWRISVGGHGGLTGSFANSVSATSDSGCIVTFNYWGSVNWWHKDGVIQKYSKDGLLDWEQTFMGFQQTNQAENEALYALEIGNNYYAQIGDSVVKFDHNGNIIFYDSSQTMPVQLMPNNDMIVNSPSLGLARLDTSGNVIWSNSISGNCGCPTTYYYKLGIGVEKIDLTDGSIVWSKTYPWFISSFDSTADGGFVASYGHYPTGVTSACNCAGPGTIFRADANGDTLWSRTYNFPYYGLPIIKVHPSGSLITGGAFLYTNKEHTFFARDYSSFLTSLDSSGHGPLETTTLTWPGDANNNQVVGFNDDALYVTIAWGETGPKRDTIDMDYSMFQNMPGAFSDYASDWTNFFGNGANHKHADFNGDGVIDTNDVTPYSMGYYFPFNIPAWRTGNQEDYNASVPDFKFVAEHDTVPPGGMIRYYIVVGSPNVVVDSVYGFLFSASFDNTLLGDTPVVNYYNSDFGNPGNNLFGYSFPGTFGPGINILFSRTDHINVYQLNDTIGEISMVAAQSISSIQSFTMNITDFKALTYHEAPVQFNLLVDSVVIDPASTVSVKNIAGDFFKVFPNPGSKFVAVSSESGETAKEITVFSAIGEKVKTIKSSQAISKIPVEDLPNGFYTGTISTEKMLKNFSFVVQH